MACSITRTASVKDGEESSHRATGVSSDTSRIRLSGWNFVSGPTLGGALLFPAGAHPRCLSACAGKRCRAGRGEGGRRAGRGGTIAVEDLSVGGMRGALGRGVEQQAVAQLGLAEQHRPEQRVVLRERRRLQVRHGRRAERRLRRAERRVDARAAESERRREQRGAEARALLEGRLLEEPREVDAAARELVGVRIRGEEVQPVEDKVLQQVHRGARAVAQVRKRVLRRGHEAAAPGPDLDLDGEVAVEVHC